MEGAESHEKPNPDKVNARFIRTRDYEYARRTAWSKLSSFSHCIYLLRLQRKDLLQLMLDAKDETGGQKIDNEDIQAQSLVFLLAGYETSSTTLAFACYHLALDTHVQDKLRDEIDRMWPEEEVGLMKSDFRETVLFTPVLYTMLSIGSHKGR